MNAALLIAASASRSRFFPPDVYVLWKRADPAFAGSWRVSAERAGAKAAAAAPAIAKPQERIRLRAAGFRAFGITVAHARDARKAVG